MLNVKLLSANRCRCPFHQDKNPSAQLRQNADGKWYFHCYVCDIHSDIWDLQSRLEGRDVADILREEFGNGNGNGKAKMEQTIKTAEPVKAKAQPPAADSFNALLASFCASNPQAKIEEQNPYTDPETGECDFYTLRYIPAPGERKRFFQAAKVNGKWQWKAPEGKLPIFNRKRVAECDNVVVVEGEKSVRAFVKLGIEGYTATTSAGGANGADKADWSPLAGKTVWLWPDNDQPGLAYAESVKSHLLALQPPVTLMRVRIEELGLDHKEDIVDYLEQNEGLPEEKVHAIRLVLQDAEHLGKTSALESKLEQIASGNFRNIPFLTMPVLTSAAKAMLPGTVTTLCGDPGVGKSFFVLEQFWRWHLVGGIDVALWMFEDDDAFHQMRALAQLTENANYADVDFIEQSPTEVRKAFDRVRPRLEKFSRCLFVANSEQKSLDEIAEWVRGQAEKGKRIIGVDPVTAAKVSDKPWKDDQKFLFAIKEIAEKYGCSVLLVTHPRLGQAGKPSLSGMAGGAAYPRFSQTVLWLRKFDEDQHSDVFTYRRSIEVRKARNGRGEGADIGLKFDPMSLHTTELGEI